VVETSNVGVAAVFATGGELQAVASTTSPKTVTTAHRVDRVMRAVTGPIPNRYEKPTANIGSAPRHPALTTPRPVCYLGTDFLARGAGEQAWG